MDISRKKTTTEDFEDLRHGGPGTIVNYDDPFVDPMNPDADYKFATLNDAGMLGDAGAAGSYPYSDVEPVGWGQEEYSDPFSGFGEQQYPTLDKEDENMDQSILVLGTNIQALKSTLAEWGKDEKDFENTVPELGQNIVPTSTNENPAPTINVSSLNFKNTHVKTANTLSRCKIAIDRRLIDLEFTGDFSEVKKLYKLLSSVQELHAKLFSLLGQFYDINLSKITPDGAIGGTGHLKPVAEIQRELQQMVTDTANIKRAIQDEFHNPLWKEKAEVEYKQLLAEKNEEEIEKRKKIQEEKRKEQERVKKEQEKIQKEKERKEKEEQKKIEDEEKRKQKLKEQDEKETKEQKQKEELSKKEREKKEAQLRPPPPEVMLDLNSSDLEQNLDMFKS